MRLTLVMGLLVILLFGVAGILVTRSHPSAEGPLVQGVAPIQRLLSRLVEPLTSFLSDLRRLGAIKAENQRQQEEVARLSAEVARLTEAELENQRLRTLLNFQQANPGWQYLTASVIGHDPSNLVQSIIIDKGKAQGVAQGMVVAADGGLVGKVVQAFDHYAKVLLVTDPSSSVSAMVQRSRASGVVRGKTGHLLTMEYLAQGDDVSQGDLIITSGFSGGFPKGLPIGRVKKVEKSDVELFQMVEVEPAFRWDRLEEVLVIVNFFPQRLD